MNAQDRIPDKNRVHILIWFPEREKVLEYECRFEGSGRLVYGATRWKEARHVLLCEIVDLFVLGLSTPDATLLEIIQWLESECMRPSVTLVKPTSNPQNPGRLRLPETSIPVCVVAESRIGTLNRIIDKIQKQRLPQRPPLSRLPIGQILARLDQLEPDQLEIGLRIQRAQKGEGPHRLGGILVDLGIAKPEHIQQALAVQHLC